MFAKVNKHCYTFPSLTENDETPKAKISTWIPTTTFFSPFSELKYCAICSNIQNKNNKEAINYLILDVPILQRILRTIYQTYFNQIIK